MSESFLLRNNFRTVIIINDDIHVFELEATLGMRVVGSLFGTPRGLSRDVFHVVGLTLGLKNPGRDIRIGDARLIEVEHHLSTVVNLRHLCVSYLSRLIGCWSQGRIQSNHLPSELPPGIPEEFA